MNQGMSNIYAPQSSQQSAQGGIIVAPNADVVARPRSTPDTAAASFQCEVINARILILDDEPIITKTVHKHLAACGYNNVITTNSPIDGLKMIERDPPDLIITDVSMPDVSGLEVLERVRQTRAVLLTPVLILTASQSHEIKHKALQLGATDFLSKPVDPSELTLRVHNALVVKAHGDHLSAPPTARRIDSLSRLCKQKTQKLLPGRL